MEEPRMKIRFGLVLVMVLVDDNLTARERREIFIEMFANVLVRLRTSEYIARAGHLLEAILYGSTDSASATDRHDGDSAFFSEATRARLERLLDFSRLKFKEKDALADVFRWWHAGKEDVSASRLWDWRLRKMHAERYDSRSNVADWDYHMRITRGLAKPSADASSTSTASSDEADAAALRNEQVSVIHSVHFRQWRDTGVAYELRESSHDQTNKSLVTEAWGRAKEFTDRNGEAKGRRVASVGYWGDCRNPPYFAIGIRAPRGVDADALFRRTNTQHVHTSVDLMERTVDGWIHAIEFGEEMPDPDAPVALSATPSSDQDAREDFAALQLGLVRLTFFSGAIAKSVLQKKAHECSFDVVSVGCWQSHTVKEDVARVARDNCVLCVERAYFMTEFKPEQVEAFDRKINEFVVASSPSTDSEGEADVRRRTWCKHDEDVALLERFGRGHAFYTVSREP